MSTQSCQVVLPFVRDALSSSSVGTWEYDFQRQLVLFDATLADLYGFSADEGEKGVSAERFSAAIHPDDRERFRIKRKSLMEYGGLFVLEYRTVVRARLRWVLVRGRYERDGAGQVVRGRGIAIDVTEGKQDGYADGLAFFSSNGVSMSAARGSALERAAEHALEARRAIDELSSQGQCLRADIDALLFRLGHELAIAGSRRGR